ETSHYLQAADLIVLPYRDGVSLRRGTLMAALAHGRPIVTTRPEMAAPQLSHAQNIWLVARDDARALAAAIDKLRQDATLRAKLASGAKRLSDAFSWEGIAARTVGFYETLDR
ncbi:MAG: glycosyltransferase, partial [Chloroflexota bacterium]